MDLNLNLYKYVKLYTYELMWLRLLFVDLAAQFHFDDEGKKTATLKHSQVRSGGPEQTTPSQRELKCREHMRNYKYGA